MDSPSMGTVLKVPSNCYSPYHMAARRCIRAFTTSPIKYILAEAGLPTIEERYELNVKRLIPKLFLCHNNKVYESVLSELHPKKLPKRKSAISICIEYAREYGILYPSLRQKESSPPWKIQKSQFVLNLEKHTKASTSSTVYHQLFAEHTNALLSEWCFIFTDGSKTDTKTSCAVVDSHGTTITAGILPNYASVYTAEAAAILNAIIYSESNNLKTVICSDSKSTLHSIMNTKNKSHLTSCIRSKLIDNGSRVKLMWVPGHAGIKGNELADERAKLASKEPLITFEYITKKDIYNLISHHQHSTLMASWTSDTHHYITHNPNRTTPNYSASCRCNDVKAFVRLRLGHTIATHSYLLLRSSPPFCLHCPTSALTIKHLLDECPLFAATRKNIFDSQIPSVLLKTTSPENILKISQYLLRTGLKQLI